MAEAAAAPVFAALGDVTRLRLVETLADGRPRSIAQLSGQFEVTRQAVTKHLRVLESAGLVAHRRVGRESRYAFRPEPVDEMKLFLERLSAEWDDALARLRELVEKD